MKAGPIIILEDDEDDVEIMTEAFRQMETENELIFFGNGRLLLDYLMSTREQPFLIISDINVPVMNGLEVREKIDANPYLRKKSIPFIFLTTSRDFSGVDKAYEMTVQGYFFKPSDFKDLKLMIAQIMGYWDVCVHPNS